MNTVKLESRLHITSCKNPSAAPWTEATYYLMEERSYIHPTEGRRIAVDDTVIGTYHSKAAAQAALRAHKQAKR